MTDAYLSSQCEVREIVGRGKGIVATTTIPAMSLLAKDTILTDNITFPLTVRIKPFPCTKTKTKTKSQSKKQQQQQIVEVTGLTRETLHEYAFANGSTYAIYPIIQLVNHGEGFGQINACVFSDPVSKTAYLISITEVQAGTEILFSYFFGFEGMYFLKKQELVKPLQDKVFEAVEKVCKKKKIAIMFDKAGDLVMIYTNPAHD
jgi:hypothetical protein